MDPADPLRNGHDPIHGTAPNQALDLFRTLGKIAGGRPFNDVADAACNLLINAIRQASPDWRRAEKTFDEFFGKSKQLLKDHYDVLGRKRGIFPYDQVVQASFHVDPDVIRKRN